ncbi:MAG TPA: TlpA disulfide reductase family protein [Thermodesulfobacteriota bacterium]|nr:TlpA disulfide reductase family protein [Thermodesulfobacteriota bacterium]
MMPFSRKILPLSVLVLFFALMAGCEKGEGVRTRGTVESVGQRAVDFTIKTFDGGEFTLQGALGRPVVVNFWASWCGPCIFEAPTLQKAYLEFAPSGVEFVGVAIQDSPEDSMGFIERYNWTFPAGPDDTGEILKAYNAFGIPKTVIIDRKGYVSYIHYGAVTENLLRREIKKLL